MLYRSKSPVWKEVNLPPFNELILSWNGTRPRGKWIFWVSLDNQEWLKFAEWSNEGQRSFKNQGVLSATNQDIVTSEKLSHSFQIRVEGDDLDRLDSLYVSLSNSNEFQIVLPKNLHTVMLDKVPRQSQMILNHPRHKDLCSPTATTTAISYLCNQKFDPIDFARKVRDEEFDIYGNWVLNVAESYHQSKIDCCVARLNDFSSLHAQLEAGKPVVVSVKGTLPGAPKIYDAGHLMCVIGFDGKKVFCIDSCFSDNESTFVGYEFKDFLRAWSLRRNLAYLFSPLDDLYSASSRNN